MAVTNRHCTPIAVYNDSNAVSGARSVRCTPKPNPAAEQIVAKAREASAIEHERTMAELKHELGRLVVETTAKVTGKVLTPEDQKRLQEEAARQVSS